MTHINQTDFRLMDQSTFKQLGEGSALKWRKNYLSYDSKKHELSIVSLNIFERIARAFGFFKSTHLKNVVKGLKEQDQLPPELINRVSSLWSKTYKKIPFPIGNTAHESFEEPRSLEKSRSSVEENSLEIQPQAEEVKPQKFYTQDPLSGRTVEHSLILDPFQFSDKGLVCLPNIGARCWCVSFLQVFTRADLKLDLTPLGIADIQSTNDLIPSVPNQTVPEKVEEMHNKIKAIAEAIQKNKPGVEDPNDYIDAIFSSQVEFTTIFDPEFVSVPAESKTFFIESRSEDSLVKDPAKIANHEGYALKGVISNTGGHWYTQVKNENNEWYSCGRFASLSDKNLIPIDEEANPVITAIIEKRPLDLSGEGQLFVYEKVE